MKLRSGRITRSTSPAHTTIRKSTGSTKTFFHRVPGSNLCRHCGRTEREHDRNSSPPARATRVIKKPKTYYNTSTMVPITPYAPSPYVLFYFSKNAHIPGTSFFDCAVFLSNLWKSMTDEERKVWEDKARAAGYHRSQPARYNAVGMYVVDQA